jgi:large subunit ribosomal protein L31
VKPEIHPAYYPAIFVDGDNEIITRSTMKSQEKRTVDGVEHNVFAVDISAYTHPFYTGKQRIVDTAGRVERFKQRYAAKGKRK